MFEAFVEECVGESDAALDERLRTKELELRRLMAERAGLVGVIDARGAFRDQHRSIAAFMRATVDTGPGSVSRDPKLAPDCWPSARRSATPSSPGTSRSTCA